MKDFQLFLKILKNNQIRQISRGYFPVVFSFLLFLSLFLGNNFLENDIISNRLNNYNFSFLANPYPESNVLGASYLENTYTTYNPNNITAEAYLVMDDGSKVLLFSKNENLRFSTASTAKIMTALVGLDYFKEKNVLTIEQNKVEGSNLRFRQGDQFFFGDLLYAMLLPSANDAAIAIAQNYPGGESGFVLKMNQKAKELNLLNTHFADPAGLLDDQSYTTPIDLARLSSFAIKNSKISEIVSTKEKTIRDVKGRNEYLLENLNILLGFDGIRGIKTGYTEGAGGVLATLKDFKDGVKTKSFIIVVMKSQDRFRDTENLLQMIRETNISFRDYSY